MIVLVFAAFRATGVADLCAHAADILRETGIAAHKCGSRPAHFCAIQPNALGHFVHVLLAEPSVHTVLTLLSIADTRFNAGLKLLMANSKRACGANCVEIKFNTFPGVLVPHRSRSDPADH
jgi:hypothetical protein